MRKNNVSRRIPRCVRAAFPEVTRVVDATVPVEVNVTGRDCGKGKKGDPSSCALARACKRELLAEGAIIGINTSYLISGKRAVRFQTGAGIAREIVSFDRSGDFAPGEYRLMPHKPSSRLGVDNRRSHTGGKEDGSHSKRRLHFTPRVRSLVTA